MRIAENGVYRDMTVEEIAQINGQTEVPEYNTLVSQYIRERYSLDEELAINRRSDRKHRSFRNITAIVKGVKQGQEVK